MHRGSRALLDLYFVPLCERRDFVVGQVLHHILSNDLQVCLLQWGRSTLQYRR